MWQVVGHGVLVYLVLNMLDSFMICYYQVLKCCERPVAARIYASLERFSGVLVGVPHGCCQRESPSHEVYIVC